MNNKPLTQYGMEELAARQRSIKPSGGVQFTRKVEGPEKIKARQAVLDLAMAWPEPRLSMLTMPGMLWRFERLLLAARQPGWFQHEGARGTHFTGCENDRAIYFAGVSHMPGLQTPASELKQIRSYSFAEMAVKTRYASYFFANIDDLMALDGWDDGWDMVWLDYTGPMSVDRLDLIARFYDRFVRSTLVITALKARFEKEATRAIKESGGYWEWLRTRFAGKVLHELEYFDTSPMAQFAIRKKPLTIMQLRSENKALRREVKSLSDKLRNVTGEGT